MRNLELHFAIFCLTACQSFSAYQLSPDAGDNAVQAIPAALATSRPESQRVELLQRLIAAMPPEVESMWIWQSQFSSADDEAWCENRPRFARFANTTGFRVRAALLGGSEFQVLPYLFTVLNKRSIVLTFDSLSVVRDLLDYNVSQKDGSVERMTIDGDSVYVVNYAAMKPRKFMEVQKTEYVAIPNEFCIVTAESLDDMALMLRRLRDGDGQTSRELVGLFDPESSSASTIILLKFIEPSRERSALIGWNIEESGPWLEESLWLAYEAHGYEDLSLRVLGVSPNPIGFACAIADSTQLVASIDSIEIEGDRFSIRATRRSRDEEVEDEHTATLESWFFGMMPHEL